MNFSPCRKRQSEKAISETRNSAYHAAALARAFFQKRRSWNLSSGLIPQFSLLLLCFLARRRREINGGNKFEAAAKGRRRRQQTRLRAAAAILIGISF